MSIALQSGGRSVNGKSDPNEPCYKKLFWRLIVV